MALLKVSHCKKYLRHHLSLGKHWSEIVFRRWFSTNLNGIELPADLVPIMENYYYDCIEEIALLWYPLDTVVVTSKHDQLNLGCDEDTRHIKFSVCGKVNKKSACIVLAGVT